MTVRAARLSGVLAQRQGMNVLNDFRRRMPDVHTYSRTGAATGRTAAGLILPFAANEAQRTDRGLVLEPQRTNKVTISNANPTALTGVTKGGDAAATLSLVNDTAALAAAGLSEICTSGQVFRLNNTAGVAVATLVLTGAAGNANSHAISGYLRGTGSASIYSSNVGLVATALTTAYVRRTVVQTTSAGASVGLRVNAGGDLYFILPMMEEGSTVTSPIVTTGAAATRGLPVFTEPVPPGRTRALLTFADSTNLTVTGLTPGGTFDVATPVIAAGKGSSGVSELVTREWLA